MKKERFYLVSNRASHSYLNCIFWTSVLFQDLRPLGGREWGGLDYPFRRQIVDIIDT